MLNLKSHRNPKVRKRAFPNRKVPIAPNRQRPHEKVAKADLQSAQADLPAEEVVARLLL